MFVCTDFEFYIIPEWSKFVREVLHRYDGERGQCRKMDCEEKLQKRTNEINVASENGDRVREILREGEVREGKKERTRES